MNEFTMRRGGVTAATGLIMLFALQACYPVFTGRETSLELVEEVGGWEAYATALHGANVSFSIHFGKDLDGKDVHYYPYTMTTCISSKRQLQFFAERTRIVVGEEELAGRLRRAQELWRYDPDTFDGGPAELMSDTELPLHMYRCFEIEFDLDPPSYPLTLDLKIDGLHDGSGFIDVPAVRVSTTPSRLETVCVLVECLVSH